MMKATILAMLAVLALCAPAAGAIGVGDIEMIVESPCDKDRTDTDSDGACDAIDADDDNDGAPDGCDPHPKQYNDLDWVNYVVKGCHS